MSRMLTNGEHDELWRNVMGVHVPNSEHYLGDISRQLRLQNAITLCGTMYTAEIMTEGEMVSNLVPLLSWIGMDKESVQKYKTRCEMKYGSKEEEG